MLLQGFYSEKMPLDNSSSIQNSLFQESTVKNKNDEKILKSIANNFASPGFKILKFHPKLVFAISTRCRNTDSGACAEQSRASPTAQRSIGKRTLRSWALLVGYSRVTIRLAASMHRFDLCEK